jgi:hypothetical protein
VKPSYEVLPIEQFGHELLDSGDLDPVYIMLQGMPEAQLDRFLVAYWCTYHVGVASYLADTDSMYQKRYVGGVGSTDYWQLLGSVAAQGPFPSPVGDRWPRGKERRHWRGTNAIQSFEHLWNRYATPEAFCDAIRSLAQDKVKDWSTKQVRLEQTHTLPFKHVDKLIRSHVGFGPWISFKIGDMAEQVMGVPVSFDQAEVFMYDTPREAACLLLKRRLGIADDAAVHFKDHAIAKVVAHLIEHFKDYKAPNGKRGVGLQEAETILCKWKSHCSGHYPLYNDIGELVEQLHDWTHVSKTATQLWPKIPQAGR